MAAKTPYHIVKSVLVTEKSTDMADDFGKYCFNVDTKATKHQIADAVEAIFGVEVSSVNTMNVTGKRKRMRTLKYGKRPDWKKAVVTLSEGEIDLI